MVIKDDKGNTLDFLDYDELQKGGFIKQVDGEDIITTPEKYKKVKQSQKQKPLTSLAKKKQLKTSLTIKNLKPRKKIKKTKQIVKNLIRSLTMAKKQKRLKEKPKSLREKRQQSPILNQNPNLQHLRNLAQLLGKTPNQLIREKM